MIILAQQIYSQQIMSFKSAYLKLTISYFFSLFFCLFNVCKNDWTHHYILSDKYFGLINICETEENPESCPISKCFFNFLFKNKTSLILSKRISTLRFDCN